jgi:hypothetical protein
MELLSRRDKDGDFAGESVRAVYLSLSRFLSAMMRLSPHNTVTGGTTHGRCTIH